MNHIFYVTGPILVAWALLVSFLGVVREGFPASNGAERLVGLVSVVLVAIAIGSAIHDAGKEKHEASGEKAATQLPS